MNQPVNEAPINEAVQDLATSFTELPEGTTAESMLPHNGRVNIEVGDTESIIAWIEASRREDGTVAIYDEVGVSERWDEQKERPGSWRPAGKKIYDFLVAGDFMVASGHGPAGAVQRIVLKGACSWRTVKIRNGVPTVGMNWVPSDFDFKPAREFFKKELAARKIELKPLTVPTAAK